LLVLGGFDFCDGMLLPGIALSNTGLEHLGPRLICGNYRMFSFSVFYGVFVELVVEVGKVFDYLRDSLVYFGDSRSALVTHLESVDGPNKVSCLGWCYLDF
jgi:hypothetical protein